MVNNEDFGRKDPDARDEGEPASAEAAAPPAAGMSRRRFAKLTGAGAIAAGVPSFVPPQATAESEFRSAPSRRPKRPNILIILADDLGYADLSCYGAPVIRTPNLDRLAASGVRFTQGYSASSVCSPTRFGLYTGRWPGRLAGGLEEPIAAPSETAGIPLDHPTLATLLRDGGYETAMIGKWHCGFLPWFSPTKLGWDSFFGNFSGGLDYFSKVSGSGDYDLFEDEVEFKDLRYYTRVITERAEEFLGAKHDDRWLLNLNFTTPHWPWEGPGDRAVSRELTARVKAGDSQALFHYDGGSLEKYREMVENLDDSIGRVMAALRRSGELENTIVLFASDNGGERFSYYWPFSGGKTDVQEGGIRVSTVLSWPGKLRARQVSRQTVTTMDWTATMLELGRVEPDPDYPLDGVSLAGYLLRGERIEQRDLFWRMRGQRALRRGNLKYLSLAEGEDRLHDLRVDPREQANLAEKEPEELESLRSAWEAINAEMLPYPAQQQGAAGARGG